MKITNFREPPPNSKAFVLGIFDIEDVDFTWDGIIYNGGAFRNWEIKAAKGHSGSYYVSAKWVATDESDPAKKVYRYAIELPEGMKRQFNAQVMELLKPYADRIKNPQQIPF